MREIAEKSAQMCDFCLSSSVEALRVRDVLYHRCPLCGGIARDPLNCLTPEEERARYLLHRNTLENTGYRTWLESFLSDVLKATDGVLSLGEAPIRSVLDWGSGPNPSFVELVREQGFQVRGWDPFFAPKDLPLSEEADLVTAIEVVEHFREPRLEFSRAARAVARGGWLALGTHTVPDRDFATWWYKEDPTHVAFWTERAFTCLAEANRLRYCGTIGPNRFLFSKVP